MKLSIPPNAPFDAAQRVWLQGFLDGMSSALNSAGAAPANTPSAPPTGHSVTIAWGSQTGTCESLSKKVAKLLSAKGHVPTVLNLQETTPEKLLETERLLLITSTYGDGEPPDNAAEFHALVHSDNAPKFSKLTYSVLALGDSSYPEFCKCGRDFDARLAALGGNQIAPLVECDVDYEEPFESWLQTIDKAFASA